VSRSVERIVTAATNAGLGPCTEVAPYRNSLRLRFGLTSLNLSPDSAFGTVRIGLRTGRVLRAEIKLGNEGPLHVFTKGHIANDLIHVLQVLDEHGIAA
jgi:hypothetical protein